jgi:hypothetical protein
MTRAGEIDSQSKTFIGGMACMCSITAVGWILCMGGPSASMPFWLLAAVAIVLWIVGLVIGVYGVTRYGGVLNFAAILLNGIPLSLILIFVLFFRGGGMGGLII